MPIPGNLLTTAMAVMPHQDVGRALEVALSLDVLSLDIYTNAEVFASYAPAIKRFLDRGGTLVWGIVPTNAEPFMAETEISLARKLEETWQVLAGKGIDRDHLLSRSLLSPATCCLVNEDKEKTVERAFDMIRGLSANLREKYALSEP